MEEIRQKKVMTMQYKRCVLHPERECTECGECNMCDLDPTKVCDNCGKCIGLDGSLEYRALKVDGIIGEDMNPDDYLYDEQTLEEEAALDMPADDDGGDDDGFTWDAGAFMRPRN